MSMKDGKHDTERNKQESWYGQKIQELPKAYKTHCSDKKITECPGKLYEYDFSRILLQKVRDVDGKRTCHIK